jgi:hypothetical protein
MSNWIPTIGFMPIVQIMFMAVRCSMPEDSVHDTNRGNLDLSLMKLTFFTHQKCYSSYHAAIYAISILVAIFACTMSIACNLTIYDDVPFYRNDEFWNPLAKSNGTL